MINISKKSIILDLIERYLNNDNYEDTNFQNLVNKLYKKIEKKRNIESIVREYEKEIGEHTIITEPLYIMIAKKYISRKRNQNAIALEVIDIL